jgi:hypothetical protein
MFRNSYVGALLSFSGILLLLAAPTRAKTLEVGPGKRYATPCQAIRHSSPGETIDVDSSGSYRGDACGWTTDRLTIRGIGTTRAKIDAAGQNAQGKGIWVIAGNDTTIENIEFSGAAVPDENGAAIRLEGANLTVRNCSFHDNQEGILAGDNSRSTVLVEFSEFSNNGSGEGSTHNIYVNHVAKFIFRFNYSHHAKVGHLVKTRAAENYVLFNRLSDEADGTASFELDISNGGTSYVLGNVIEQGPETQNSSILAYMMEGPDARNPGTQLYVVNNTFVNDRPQGATFLQIRGDLLTPVLVLNNIFVGKGLIATQKNAILKNNLVQRDPHFIDPTHYDYRLRPDSPARNAGAAPSIQAAFPLLPDSQYVHPACGAERAETSQPDLGAFSLGIDSAHRVGPPRCLLPSSVQ